jgi:hypothetical protein
MFNTAINFDEIKESQYGKLADGKYLVIIDSVHKSMWANSTGGGKAEKLNMTFDPSPESPEMFVEFKYQVIEGERIGVVHYDNLYLWAENEIRKNISRSIYKKICAAVSVDASSCKVDDLINKPLSITLKTDKTGKYLNVVNAEKHNPNGNLFKPNDNDDTPF